jgi:hypothetical protein
MFDLNQILSAALNAAVAEAVAPLVERIEKLEFALADRHQRLLVLEGALTDRVVALENNPAIGVDTTLMRDVAAEVNKVVDSEDFWHRIGNYVTEQVSNTVEAKIEEAMDDHTSSYDHDQYDEVYNEWGSESPDNFLKDEYVDDQIEEKVKEVLNNASFSISI